MPVVYRRSDAWDEGRAIGSENRGGSLYTVAMKEVGVNELNQIRKLAVEG